MPVGARSHYPGSRSLHWPSGGICPIRRHRAAGPGSCSTVSGDRGRAAQRVAPRNWWLSGLNTVGRYRSQSSIRRNRPPSLSGVGNFKPWGKGRVGARVRTDESAERSNPCV